MHEHQTNGLTIALEHLEPRRMLSASIAHRVLLIDGTPRADRIVLARGKRAVTVHVNGEVSQFSLKSFGTIRIRAGKGDDLVTIGTNDSAVAAAAFVIAGAGNDTVITCEGNDTVEGEGGDDQLSTAAGNDLVDGGMGHDQIYGGKGNDSLHGDNNADTIFGGDGDDEISGGPGDDELYDGIGVDQVYGNGGTDSFHIFEFYKKLGDANNWELVTEDTNDRELVATPMYNGRLVWVFLRSVDAGDTGGFDQTNSPAFPAV
jgi:Ca2+-binding RTX toxin-like protein